MSCFIIVLSCCVNAGPLLYDCGLVATLRRHSLVAASTTTHGSATRSLRTRTEAAIAKTATTLEKWMWKQIPEWEHQWHAGLCDSQPQCPNGRSVLSCGSLGPSASVSCALLWWSAPEGLFPKDGLGHVVPGLCVHLWPNRVCLAPAHSKMPLEKQDCDLDPLFVHLFVRSVVCACLRVGARAIVHSVQDTCETYKKMSKSDSPPGPFVSSA